MSQHHKDPPAAAGVHLVSTVPRDEASLASDVVDILQAATRGSSDTDVGGVEETYLTTLEQDQARIVERQFLEALAQRVKQQCPWADGRRGLRVGELGDRHGWRFSLFDTDGRPFECEISYSHIAQVAAMQRAASMSNFGAVLDSVCEKLQEARGVYFARRDSLEISS